MNNITRIFNKICIDERIKEGVFFMEDNDHMDILQEYLMENGISIENSTYLRNKMIEGKYPERQAYNANGILVTFPSPEYKQRAIERGTHFEENPKKGQANIFQQPQQPTPAQQPAPAQPTQQPQAPVQPTLSVAQPVEQPLSADVDTRKPEEKEEDARAIEQMLSDAPASIDITMKYPNLESVSYTLAEAFNNGFYIKDGKCYTPEGQYVGKKWYCDHTGKLLITP